MPSFLGHEPVFWVGVVAACLIAVIQEAFGKSWQAAAWWLERRKHEDYAQRQRVDMNVDLHRVAEKLADADGLDADALIAEAERIVSEA